MVTGPTADFNAQSVEDALRAQLVAGDRMLADALPALPHLLAADDPVLFGPDVLALVRGVLLDLAGQLLAARAETAGDAEGEAMPAEGREGLARLLAAERCILSHVHAIAIEARMIARIAERSGLDPVLTPLAEDHAGSPGQVGSVSGRAVLAAQARFVQRIGRMEHPLAELPGEQFHLALLALRSFAGERDPAVLATDRKLRSVYDEGAGRLAIIARFLAALALEPVFALDARHAGLSVFLSALALSTGQARDSAILALGECQLMRLALSLRAAGLDDRAMQSQFFLLHPYVGAPVGFDALSPDRAAALLGTGGTS